MNSTKIYTEKFKIRANEVDNNGKITLPAISGLFQEIAGNHALLLNFDITDLHKQGLTWVLHRMDIEVIKLPNWRDEITIETWPAAGDTLRAYRNYRILDQDNNELVVSLSYWMMINLETRRPTRLSDEILNTRLSDREHVLPVKTDRIGKLDETAVHKDIAVRRADLDMNRHVNNVHFLEWMMETLNEGQLARIKKIDIQFIKEAVYGDVINSKMSVKSHDSSLHQLENQKGEIVAKALMHTL